MQAIQFVKQSTFRLVPATASAPASAHFCLARKAAAHVAARCTTWPSVCAAVLESAAAARGRPAGQACRTGFHNALTAAFVEKGHLVFPTTTIACFGCDEEAEPSYGSHGGGEHPRIGGSCGRVRLVHSVGDARHSVDGRWSGRLAALSKLSRCSLCHRHGPHLCKRFVSSAVCAACWSGSLHRSHQIALDCRPHARYT